LTLFDGFIGLIRSYLNVGSSVTPDEVVASVEVVVFILVGLVVIPLVWSRLNKGRDANITVKPNMYKPGEPVQGGGGALWGRVSFGSSVSRDIPASKLQVKEDFYQDQLERYEERKKRRQQSQNETSIDS
jgi:hypothetical protein